MKRFHPVSSVAQRIVALALLCAFTLESIAYAGLESGKSLYVGGTVSAIPQNSEGKINADDPKIVVFHWDKGDWSTPYAKVTALSYGQHAGRRVGATVALGVTTLGIGALPMLFSKKRRHYLTIEYTDDAGAAQAAIFEVGKDAIRVLLKTLEVRSGKKVEYEDEEARKAGNK